MYQETMNEIHRTANERLTLYLLAGKQNLTTQQTQRLHELSNLLPVLWDRYRREYAGRNRALDTTKILRAA